MLHQTAAVRLGPANDALGSHAPTADDDRFIRKIVDAASPPCHCLETETEPNRQSQPRRHPGSVTGHPDG